MGSTDDQGNRLSNMPGEERPSINSVTPYDDSADQLVEKVNNICLKAAKDKKRSTKPLPNEASLGNHNTLKSLTSTNQQLLQSKKVLANDGKQFDRNNFVRINQDKKGKYKPAMRGAAFTNKIMAKKSNVMKFRNRMQAKIMAERA